jgi:hypothetical protein
MRAVTGPDTAVDPRKKNFLTEAELEGLLKAARKGPPGSQLRDAAPGLPARPSGKRADQLAYGPISISTPVACLSAG